MSMRGMGSLTHLVSVWDSIGLLGISLSTNVGNEQQLGSTKPLQAYSAWLRYG